MPGTSLVFAVLVLLFAAAPAAAGPPAQAPAAVCRDCQRLIEQLRILRLGYQELAQQIEADKQAHARAIVELQAVEADFANAQSRMPPDVALLQRLGRRVQLARASVQGLAARVAANESRLRETAQRITSMAADLNRCNRNCGQAAPGTPVLPPQVTDEPIPAPECDKCKPVAARVAALQKERRAVLDEIGRLESNRSAFEAALEKLDADLKDLSSKGVSMSDVRVDGQPLNQFFGDAMDHNMGLAVAVAALELKWSGLDRDIATALEELARCNADCKKETGWFQKPATYYALAGAAAGSLLIAAGGGGDGPAPVSTPAPTPSANTPVTPPASTPPSPPPSPAPAPAPAGRMPSATQTLNRCVCVVDTALLDGVLRFCQSVSVLNVSATSSGVMRVALPGAFPTFAGQFNTTTGAFALTAIGSAGETITFGGVVDASGSFADAYINFDTAAMRRTGYTFATVGR